MASLLVRRHHSNSAQRPQYAGSEAHTACLPGGFNFDAAAGRSELSLAACQLALTERSQQSVRQHPQWHDALPRCCTNLAADKWSAEEGDESTRGKALTETMTAEQVLARKEQERGGWLFCHRTAMTGELHECVCGRSQECVIACACLQVTYKSAPPEEQRCK